MHCIAHYTNSNRTCGTLKELSDNQLNRLLEAKNVRKKNNWKQTDIMNNVEQSQRNLSLIHLSMEYT